MREKTKSKKAKKQQKLDKSQSNADVVCTNVVRCAGRVHISTMMSVISYSTGGITVVPFTPWAIKNVPLYFCPYLHQLLTNFQNFFTGTLCRQFAIMPLSHHTVNPFLHYLVKYKCKQKLTTIKKILVNVKYALDQHYDE